MDKRGFTLLEVLAVVIIIGILSALGYSSLMDVIYKTRAKDAAVNTASFIDRVAMESKRMDADLTINFSSGTFKAFKNNDPIASLDIAGFTSGGTISLDGQNGLPGASSGDVNDWHTKNISFTRRIGISNLAEQGYITFKYGRFCGAAIKVQEQNFVKAYLSSDNCTTWGEI